MSNFLRVVPAGDGQEQLINLDNVDTISEFNPGGVSKIRVVFSGGNEQEFAGFTLQQFADLFGNSPQIGITEIGSKEAE